MPPHQPESVAEWLSYARSDLTAARRSAGPGVRWEKVCFDAQQAAERAVKAVLIHLGRTPPRTHYIEQLIKLLPAGLTKAPELVASIRLSQYAADTRYPGGGVIVTEEDYREAIRLATAVVEWAEEVTSKGKESSCDASGPETA